MQLSEYLDSKQRSCRPDEYRARAAMAHANLEVMAALLNAGEESEPFAPLFQALRNVFIFDQVMALKDRDEFLDCVAAEPQELVGLRWIAGPLFQDILCGGVRIMPAGCDSELWRLAPPGLASSASSALCLPVCIGECSGVLLLLRDGGKDDFGDIDLAHARQFAVIALAMLASQKSDKLGAEVEDLRNVVDRLRKGEQQAQQDYLLLKKITDLLPVSLTVQDDKGRFLLVNAIAAGNLAMPQDMLIGTSPADFLSPEDAANWREEESSLIRSGKTVVGERHVTGAGGDKTWLTTHKPVRIADQTLLLTTSLDITERKRIEDELARRAYFDELTGLPNRIVLQEHVERALQRNDLNGRFALAFIDLDNFKHINDYYSHAVGDALLVKVAERISMHIRNGDVLARISGDEFLLLVEPVESEEQINGIIERLLEDLKQPFHIEGFEVFTSASIGVSVYPEHGRSYEALRRNADNAMYRAKNESKGNAIYFDLRMGEILSTRMEQEQRLRLAIRDHKFCCAFQPKVDIHSQKVVGFEALVRWRDDDGQLHAPSTFIGLATELGLIDSITQFVLDEAVRSIAYLDETFGPTVISVNVAARQASDLRFMRCFVEALKSSDCADRIMIELTEDALLAKSGFQAQVLPMLRQIGARVSIDDFGTGYSSLAALADITADEIKVDRSFITDIHQRPRSQSILRTIESLSHALGMDVVAEGVETFEELAYLQAATRIRFAQGFYFSKPFFLENATAHCHVTSDGHLVRPAREQDYGRIARPARMEANAR